MALIAHAATLEARVPFLHFYDGFRISHEVNKIEQLTDEQVAQMIDMDLVAAHRGRALSPENPQLRGTAQNPDVFFQAREACNKFYDACPGIVQKTMDKFAGLFGRQYHLFDYVGAPDAERVIVCMGSGSGVVEETVDYLAPPAARRSAWSRCISSVPWTRPPCWRRFPRASRRSPCLDRTKEPGSNGEPLYQDVVTAMAESWRRPAAEDHRRTLRPELEGIHAGPREGRLRRTVEGPAEAAVHRRHQGRRDLPEPRLGRRFLHRRRRRDPGRVLRPGQRRHRQRQPQLGEDHRREHADVLAGLFRLRLAEGGFGHHVARPLQPAADQGLVPRAQGELRGLPPVPFHRADRHALDGHAGGDVPLEQPLRPGRGLGPPALRSAEADCRQEAEVLRGRCLQGGPRGRTGRPHQHRDADLLLQAGQRDSAGRGDQRNQGPGQGDLRQEGRRRRSSSATTRPSTRPWPACTRSRCRPRSARSSTWCRPFPTMPPPSSRTCWA